MAVQYGKQADVHSVGHEIRVKCSGDGRKLAINNERV
jgi:hypothetical protein